MIPDWAKSVELSIKKYEEVKDLIKEGFYGMAAMELQNSYVLLNMTVQDMGMTGNTAHILALSARLQLLSEECKRQEEGIGQKRNVQTALEYAEKKIKEVEEKLLKDFQGDSA